MSNNEIVENEEQEYIEQEERSAPSGMSLFVDKIKNWLNGQNKLAVYGIGGLLVLVLGYGGYKYLYQMPREQEGIAAIYNIQNDFENDSFRLVLKNGPKMADKYSGTKAGELCNYMVGMSYMYTGDYKKALSWLEKVSFDDEVMSAMATGNIGDCYVELKDLDNGLKYYLKAVSKSKTDYTAVHYLMKSAKIYEKQNQWEKALEQYETVKTKYSEEESYTTEIDKYIARAQAKLDKY